MNRKIFIIGVGVGIPGIVISIMGIIFGNADATNWGRVAGIGGAVLVGISFAFDLKRQSP